MITDEFIKSIQSESVIIKKDEPMYLHTSFRIGGNAECFCEVRSIDALRSVVSACKGFGVPYFIIGLGSNLLVSDEGICGVVIKLGGDFDEVEVKDNNTLRCGAGISLAGVCICAKNNNLGGMEFAWGIPGSMGGAVYMNAGAYGGEMKDIVVSSRYLDGDGNIREISGEEHKFSYRNSFYTDKDYIILDVTLKLNPKNKNEIFYLMQDTMERRKAKQPLNRPSAGSVFKRPEGYYAAALIEQCGLKGLSLGDAQVSEKHSGFIVNNGSASAKDVLELIEKVKNVVREKTGVELQCEIKYIG